MKYVFFESLFKEVFSERKFAKDKLFWEVVGWIILFVGGLELENGRDSCQ